MAELKLAEVICSLAYPDFVEPESIEEDDTDYGPAKGHVEVYISLKKRIP